MVPLLLTLVLQIAQGAPVTVSGSVRDATGAAVVGATVTIEDTGQQTTTDAQGRFTLTCRPAGEVRIRVRAAGFTEWRQTVVVGAAPSLDVVLMPEGVLETITVTPARGAMRLGDVPASMSVLTSQQVRQSPAVVADDVLRQLPAFSLFRRTSSLAAHPTTQGVSLRGLGPSGVSRTLVLLDGVPFNDPFGGWVYWSRIPLEYVERIEVVDGASASLYGNYAMGGVINIVSAPPAPKTLSLKARYGSLNTWAVEGLGSHVRAGVGLTVDAGWFQTDGYTPVVRVNPAGLPERGAVDNDISVETGRLNARVEIGNAGRLRGVVRVGHFREKRNNGKHSTFTGQPEYNRTEWTSASGQLALRLSDRSNVDASVSLETGSLRSRFLAVPVTTPPRSIGRMTLEQRVPTLSHAGMIQWNIRAAERHAVTAGADWRWVNGDSEEDTLDALTGTSVTGRRVVGGTQRAVAGFTQYIVSATPALTITSGLRVDRWQSVDAHTSLVPSRTDTVLTPRVAAIYRITDRVSVWSNIGTGFRAPTLNELYRDFRVGAVLTLANNQLGPERLRGAELGIQVTPSRTFAWRATWFDNRMVNPVANVTVSVAGTAVTQQRQNLGSTSISGLQTSADYRVGSAWRLAGAYIHQRARVVTNPVNAALVGRQLAQVPRHRGSVQITFTHAQGIMASVEVLAMSRQFDDDLNTRTIPGLGTPGLPGYAAVSLSMSKRLGERLESFVGIQNVFDRQSFVGTLPTTTGAPRMVTGGFRVRLGR